MDESTNEVSEHGLPDREDGMALSIEDTGESGAALYTLETTGSLTGMTVSHYLVGERLGGGAMAAVYRAQDQILDRSVAIKVLLPGADAVMQARFRREARTVSILVHPHIVRTIQVGRGGGIIYIAMELVEGISLGELLDRYGKLTVADAAHILAPVAQALAYAHSEGIIHRDVKPSNILLKRANPGAEHSVAIAPLPYPVIPLLSDFGIARALDAPELTNAGRTIGTPAFMAPEQCAGSSDIDGRADVYALGAVLYRCLVGRPPFAGTTTQILHAHVYDPLLIPDAVANALPAQVVRVMARAMMKEPSQRYANVELMATDLLAVADLPVTPVVDAPVEVTDPTMTMASLPVAQPSASTSRVLVPAAAVGVPRGTHKPMGRAATGTTGARAIPVAPPPAARKRERTGRWGIMALGGAFVVLILLFSAYMIYSMLPGIGEDNPGTPTNVPTVAVAENETPQAPIVVPEVSPESNSTVVTPQNTAGTAEPTPQPTPTGPTPTATSAPLSGDIETAWTNAQTFYDEGAWDLSSNWLILTRRHMDTEDSDYEDEIDRGDLNEMLVASYLGLVTDVATDGQWDKALDYIADALEIRPDDETLLNMRVALQGLAELADSTEASAEAKRLELREAIATIFRGFAEQLALEEQACHALLQIENAQKLFVSEEQQELQDELTGACSAQESTTTLLETGGTILYSSVDQNVYRIFVLPVDENMVSTLLVNNGAQPQLSPDGSMLAFYNRQPGQDGLWGFAMGQGLSPDQRSVHYSANPEDSRDGPPSWNWSSSQLAYGSTRSADPSVAHHLYITSADADPGSEDHGYGKDPAWQPNSNWLVYNGPENSGAGPTGLWLMRANGEEDVRMTENGNDLRPTWTPDGLYIVFMSKDRLSDNWDLYRLDIESGAIMRLTVDPAQDGLPAVSPDGKWVAFMSDREQVWRIWYVSIDGGEERLLSNISGQPVQWLEHAIQWVP